MEQMIISISREFGSGGRELAEMLAQAYSLPLYEKNILQAAGIPWNDEVESYYNMDGQARFFNSTTLRGLTRTNEEAFSAIEFQYLIDQAKAGASFIVLGHCAEEILKDCPCLLSFFISAGDEFKIGRIMKKDDLTRTEAIKKMRRHNKRRKSYHNQYVSHPWGDSRYYDYCLKSDVLGLEKTFHIMQEIINQRFGQSEH